MDLLDFPAQDLYFDQPTAPEVLDLLEQAAQAYASGGAEPLLARAHELAPGNLLVLVALYRFFYYQHRLEDALGIAERALENAAEGLGLPLDWRCLTPADLDRGARVSMTLLRFHLQALKGAGYLMLRLGDPLGARERLTTLVALDEADRLGGAALLALAEEASRTTAAGIEAPLGAVTQ